MRDLILEHWLQDQGIDFEYRDAIPVPEIQIDKQEMRNIRLSDTLNEEVLDSFMQSMKQRGSESFPAIALIRRGDHYAIMNGLHRTSAMKQLELKTTDAYVLDVTDHVVADRIRRTINTLNGLRPSLHELLEHGCHLVQANKYSVIDAARLLNIRRTQLESYIRQQKTMTSLVEQGVKLEQLRLPKSFYTTAHCVKDPQLLKRVAVFAHKAGLTADQCKDFIQELYQCVNDHGREQVIEAWTERFADEIQRSAGGTVRGPSSPIRNFQVQLARCGRMAQKLEQEKEAHMTATGVTSAIRDCERTMKELSKVLVVLKRVRTRLAKS